MAATLTSEVYGAIRYGRYEEAVRYLNIQRQSFPRSRAALSLLAYCFYHMQDFQQSAQTYEELIQICPEVDEYRLYYAQALFKCGNYPEALKAALRVGESPQLQQKVISLQASIKYELDELPACKNLLDECLQDDPETIANYAAVSYKEGRFQEARKLYQEAMQALGFLPKLAYNIALCHYKEEQYGEALKLLADLIERGVRAHPELSVGSGTDGVDVRSVGNSQTLLETCLVEAFNLKMAIEYQMSNLVAAREALTDMPPRSEQELDALTLHNQALIDTDLSAQGQNDPSAGFRKLNFLLANPPFPPEAFGNTLVLHCKFGFHDLAADLLAENATLAYKFLSTDLYEFLDASIMTYSSPEEAYRKFDLLTTKHIDNLRKLTKAIQDARLSRENEAIKSALRNYDDALEKYIPVLMAQAKIYWDKDNYAAVERLFRQSAEFCSEHETWRLNVAHVFFMQEKFKDAIRYYDPIVKKSTSILDIPAIVLANLCVAYIMTSQNEDAEELMRKIEKEEDRLDSEPDSPLPLHKERKPCYHLCIVNLVIGTLYCAKGNFEFGISRVIKSLEPYEKKLGPDTWFYSKRCFLALAEHLAKHMLLLKDAVYDDILAFFDAAELHGTSISTQVSVSADAADPNKPASTSAADDELPKNVAAEARLLKRVFLKLRD